MSKGIRCTDCYNNRGNLCKLGNKDVFNTKKSKQCGDFDAVSANRNIPNKPATQVETKNAPEVFLGKTVAYRFYV